MTGQQQSHYFHWGLSIVCHVYVTLKEYSGYILQEFVVFCLELPISIETLTYALPHQVDLCSLLHCLLDSHMLQKFDICESSSLARNNLGLSLQRTIVTAKLFCMVFKFFECEHRQHVNLLLDWLSHRQVPSLNLGLSHVRCAYNSLTFFQYNVCYGISRKTISP